MAGVVTTMVVIFDLVDWVRLDVEARASGITARLRADGNEVVLSGAPDRVAGLLRDLADKVDTATRERARDGCHG